MQKKKKKKCSNSKRVILPTKEKRNKTRASKAQLVSRRRRRRRTKRRRQKQQLSRDNKQTSPVMNGIKEASASCLHASLLLWCCAPPACLPACLPSAFPCVKFKVQTQQQLKCFGKYFHQVLPQIFY
jgi:hypothetical protein